MAVDATIALVTLAEAKVWLGISDDNDNQDSLINTLIDAASDFVKLFTGRKFIKPDEAETEYYSGYGGVVLYLDNKPISSISDISYRSGSTGSSWTTITGQWTYEYDATKGIIHLTDGNVFTSGFRNWRVQYIYGYVTADVPNDIKMAVMELVAIKKTEYEKKLHGVQAITLPNQSVSYSLLEIPKQILRILSYYRVDKGAG